MPSRRIAVLGTGKVAAANYLPYLCQLPDVELLLWNRTADQAGRLGDRFDAAVATTIGEVIEWDPEIAFVLTSERARLPIATQLIEAELPRVFMEKPLTARAGQANVTEQDFRDARDLLRLADERGCQTAINFNYRFFSSVIQARQEIDGGRWGSLTGITARAHYACWSHTLDLLRFFAGDVLRLSAVSGREVREGRGMSAPDLAVAFETVSGAVGTVNGTAAGPWEGPLLDISLELESARLRIWDLDGGLTVTPAGSDYVQTRGLGAGISRWDRYAQSFRSALDAYLASVAAHEPPPVGAFEGLRELQLEAAIRRSANQGTVIGLEQEFPL